LGVGGHAEALQEERVTVEFPSLEFFQALAERMRGDAATFEKLGYCDTEMGVAVTGGPSRTFALSFDVYECVDVREVDADAAAKLDFVLEAEPEVWLDIFQAIREHGGADAAHSLNTLSHLGDAIRVRYEDPEGHDKFYRYMASLQAFFDLARDVELAPTRA
jgi:hypothetical protein